MNASLSVQGLEPSPRRACWKAIAATAALLASHVFGASAPDSGLSGKEVVTAVCAGCHGAGEKGAPKIGDKQVFQFGITGDVVGNAEKPSKPKKVRSSTRRSNTTSSQP